jgi:hypothetical protein
MRERHSVVREMVFTSLTEDAVLNQIAGNEQKRRYREFLRSFASHASPQIVSVDYDKCDNQVQRYNTRNISVTTHEFSKQESGSRVRLGIILNLERMENADLEIPPFAPFGKDQVERGSFVIFDNEIDYLFSEPSELAQYIYNFTNMPPNIGKKFNQIQKICTCAITQQGDFLAHIHLKHKDQDIGLSHYWKQIKRNDNEDNALVLALIPYNETYIDLNLASIKKRETILL